MRRKEFVAAMELLRVGEVALAREELGWMGALGVIADKNKLWLIASMFHEVGAYRDAIRLSRQRLQSFAVTAPKGKARPLWRIAFPRAYAPLIEEVAKEAGVPAAFVRAVAREESGFNPRAVSPAHAYGLIQLIRPTAKTHAKALKLKSDPASLMKPEINLRIGSSFIRFLWKRYADNPAVVPSAYNAGHGAADRWLKERPDQDLDAWVEAIPYSETKRYTRRVLQSYGIYSFLDTGKLPPLARALPKKK
jgi:soluble lytic murein transglycosylase